MLIIDVFNDYSHPDAEQLADHAAGIIDPLVGLINGARKHDPVDLIYVNDNHGNFTADHRAIISGALEGKRPGLVKPLVPPSDTCVIDGSRLSASSPEHSAHRAGRPGHRAMHSLQRAALKMMERNMAAELVPAARCLPQ